jgi:hypothetical protein
MSNCNHLHFFYYTSECAFHDIIVLLQSHQSSLHLLLLCQWSSQTPFESHGVFGLIIFEEQFLHNSSPTPTDGVQNLEDPCVAQHALVQTRLHLPNAPLFKRAIQFISHNIYSYWFFATSWILFCDKSASRLTPIYDIDGTWNIIFLVFFGRWKCINTNSLSSSIYVLQCSITFHHARVRTWPIKLFPTFFAFLWTTIISLCNCTSFEPLNPIDNTLFNSDYSKQ